jgi:hypothetical protein
VFRRFAHDEKTAAKVRRDNFIETVDVALLDWSGEHDARAVHDNGYFPERGLGLLEKPGDLGRLRDSRARTCSINRPSPVTPSTEQANYSYHNR